MYVTIIIKMQSPFTDTARAHSIMLLLFVQALPSIVHMRHMF